MKIYPLSSSSSYFLQGMCANGKGDGKGRKRSLNLFDEAIQRPCHFFPPTSNIKSQTRLFTISPFSLSATDISPSQLLPLEKFSDFLDFEFNPRCFAMVVSDLENCTTYKFNSYECGKCRSAAVTFIRFPHKWDILVIKEKKSGTYWSCNMFRFNQVTAWIPVYLYKN